MTRWPTLLSCLTSILELPHQYRYSNLLLLLLTLMQVLTDNPLAEFVELPDEYRLLLLLVLLQVLTDNSLADFVELPDEYRSLLLLLALLQVLTDNPLADFVELPDEYRSLRYSNLLPGVIRGGLEMVRLRGYSLIIFITIIK
jgi:hypothetical protein